MAAAYDDQGNYIYPEGFDSETGEWLEGFDKQREEWERQYTEAQNRFESHKKQIEESRKAEAEAGVEQAGASTYTSEAPEAGTLATDEALAALREKLAGGGQS